jgi:hypothetical protein
LPHCHADHTELMEMILGSQGRQVVDCHLLSPGFPPRVGHQPCGGWSSCHHLHQEVYYADGGRSTRYLGSDDDEAETQGNNDSPGTRRYTFEDDDQPESSDCSSMSSKPSCSSLPTSTSQDDPPVMPPKMGCKATTPISTIGSPIRYPSLKV